MTQEQLATFIRNIESRNLWGKDEIKALLLDVMVDIRQ